MRRLFTSFDEAWRFFLNRKEKLADFFAPFPQEETFLLGWLIQLDDALVPAVQQAKDALLQFDWITPQPDHFLHTWLGGVALAPRRPTRDEIGFALERAERAWATADGFNVSYGPINCFHSAIVVEVEGDGPRTLVSKLIETGYWNDLPIEGALPGVPIETFLAHLTIGTVKKPSDPAPLRDVLARLREARLGRQRITRASLCVIPASRTTILDPWEVVGSVVLGGDPAGSATI